MDIPFRLTICHRNRLLTECLCSALNQIADFQCSATESEPVMQAFSVCDLLMVDAALPALTVTGLIRQARQRNRDCRVLLLVSHLITGRMMEFAKLGADGCLCDQSDMRELQIAVRAILKGETYCSTHAANALFHSVAAKESWGEATAGIRLTSREQEVLELIAWERLGNKQIARKLGISVYTVKNHVHNLIEKLGVCDRREAVEKASRMMLLSHNH